MAVEAPGTLPAVTGAIRHASRVTGTNFQYLVATAQVESKFNPSAAAPTSTARGLFQFIEQTWLATLKEQGPALGYGQLANAIERAPAGNYVVSDPKLNDRIMRLRNDPTINAVMAGAYTKANSDKLAERLGRNPSEGELYVAHFLGSQGAGRLISLAEARPTMRADEAFPTAARANQSIFYDRAGKPRSVADVYRSLVNRYATARNASDTAAPAQVAAAPEKPQPAAVTQVTPTRAAFAPDSPALTEAFAAAERLAALPKQIAEATPVFHGLFRSNEGREPIAPAVSALWSAPSAVTEPAGQSSKQAVAAPASPPRGGIMSLFQDQASDARALFRGRV